MNKPHPFVLTMLTECCSELGLTLPGDAWWIRFHDHLPPGILAAVEAAVSGGAVNWKVGAFDFGAAVPCTSSSREVASQRRIGRPSFT